MNQQLAWHVARAAGLVAWALTAGSVLGGFALSGRFVARRILPPVWLAEVHRFVGGLAVVFTAVHVGALLVDDYVRFSVVDVLVPFASEWRPGPVAWGVVSLYLLLAVQISTVLRRRLTMVWWRRLHLLSVPLFGIATMHLVTAGTDATHPSARGVVLVTATTFVFLAVYRVLSRPPRRPAPRGRPRSPGIQPSAAPRPGTR